MWLVQRETPNGLIRLTLGSKNYLDKVTPYLNPITLTLISTLTLTLTLTPNP